MSDGKQNVRAKSNIYLIGFMTSGKSTVGKILAEYLHRIFFDTDNLIENKMGLTISKIFQVHGESYFRDLETEMVKYVSNKQEAVVALGGGAILREENWDLIKYSGTTFYLKWEFEALLPRLLNSLNRPLLATNEMDRKVDEIKRLFDSRKKEYERVDYLIDCLECSKPVQIVHQIKKILEAQI